MSTEVNFPIFFYMSITQDLKISVREISQMSTEANFAIKYPSVSMAFVDNTASSISILFGILRLERSLIGRGEEFCDSFKFQV